MHTCISRPSVYYTDLKETFKRNSHDWPVEKPRVNVANDFRTTLKNFAEVVQSNVFPLNYNFIAHQVVLNSKK